MSYIWGIASRSERIFIDEKAEQPGQILVASNPLRALDAIYRSFGDEWMWIDAICVGQGSKAEKSFQVPQMGHIYRRAVAVVVWLGETRNGLRIPAKTLEWLHLRWLLRELDQMT